jgi:AcrR family transcriptional regulator
MAVLSRHANVEQTRRDNREAILAATLDLLADGTPFAELSVEQIVRGAGLSRPTFYKYFRDKRALVLELGTALMDAVAAAADPWLQSGEGETRETLAAVLNAFRERRATLGALVEAATYDAEVHAFWHAFHDRFLDIAAERIGAAEPDLPPARARARAFALVWMTERTITEFLLGDAGIDEAALLDELAGFWRVGPRD